MKKILSFILALVALVSCQSLIEEWQPVFTFNDNAPAEAKTYTDASIKEEFGVSAFTTIADLKLQYKNRTQAELSKGLGHTIKDNIWIKGRVISDDKSGNIYREMYIQDETGAIDLKLGKSSLYSEFCLGQMVYVHCTDLCIGSYEGMPQLGLQADNTSTNEYESSYIDVQAIIDGHVFKGDPADAQPIASKVVTQADIAASLSAGFYGELWGTNVTLSGLTYGDEIFALLYPHSVLPHKKDNPYNRVFLSSPQTASNRVDGFDYTWGIKTWAMSKAKYIENINSGLFNDAVVGSGNTKFGPITTKPIDYKNPSTQKVQAAYDKYGYTPSTITESVLAAFGPDANLTFADIMKKHATAAYVSHYFNFGATPIQVRTSGYAKFADQPLDPRILAGESIEMKGILTLYQGSAQMSLITAPDDSTNPSIKIQ